MSIYSQENMTTEIVRPVYHNNNRTEFELPRKVCLSNMRMINVGCSVTAPAGTFYPITSGCMSLIRNTYLYCNDNIEVSVLRNASKYLAFQNSRRANDEEYSLVSQLSQH